MHRDGTRYAGEYKYDEETGKVSGCPARAASIETFIKAVRTKAGVKGAAATRNHAEAMTIEDLKKLMDWSEKQCSPKMLQKELESLDELKKTEMHGLMRAFLASGFTLWTRCVAIILLALAVQSLSRSGKLNGELYLTGILSCAAYNGETLP